MLKLHNADLIILFFSSGKPHTMLILSFTTQVKYLLKHTMSLQQDLFKLFVQVDLA